MKLFIPPRTRYVLEVDVLCYSLEAFVDHQDEGAMKPKSHSWEKLYPRRDSAKESSRSCEVSRIKVVISHDIAGRLLPCF